MSRRLTQFIFASLYIFLSTITYSQTTFRGVVLDAKNKAPIVNAKIGITGQGIGEITNEKGYFVYSKYHEVLGEDSVLEISAPGYKPITKKESEIRQLFGAASTVYLEKDQKYKGKANTSFEDIVLYWDVSASSGKRDFNVEWETVSHFIQQKAVKNVKLVAFNTTIVWEEAINLSEKPWAALRDKLGTIRQEGLSNYDVVDGFNKDAILLVSNGNSIFGEGHFSSDIPVFTIVSGKADNAYLNKLSKFTGGETIYLDASAKIDTHTQIVQETASILGKITSVSGPIQGASIRIKGNLEEYFSNVDGSFSIPATGDDVITFSYLGMHDKTIAAKEVLRLKTIKLIPKADVLDEVTLKGQNDIVTDKIDIGVGERSLNSFGFGTALIRQENIPKSAVSVLDILRGRVSGVRVSGLGADASLSIRNCPSTGIAWVVDGNIYIQSDNFLVSSLAQPQDIKRLLILKSAAETRIFGPETCAAVIIETISGFSSKHQRTIEDVLVKGNEYTEELSSIDNGIVSQEERSFIKGKVYNPAGPIQGASILRKGSFDEYFSKVDGSFAIPATSGDILNFSYLGMHSKGVIIEDESQFLDVAMEPIAELLDEVVLQGKEREDEKIITAYGKESRDQIGYSVNYLTSDEIKPSAQYVSDILRGRFAGVTVTGFGPTANLTMRPGLGTPESPIPSSGGVNDPANGNRFAWVIDNSIILATLGEVNSFIDPHNIESISVLKSSIATNRYGTIAIAGAIVIKTKTLQRLNSNGDTVGSGSALVKGNTYDENLNALNATVNVPSYIKELSQLQSIDERYARYEELANAQDPNVAFYVDMAQYFQEFDTIKANKILDKLASLGRSNVKVLRVLAYLYEAGKDYDKARLTYERILKLAPSETQSYRDLALIYQEVGAYNKSLELYINMLGEQIKGLDFSGLEKPLKSELNHLVARYKDKIDFGRLPNEWLRVGYKVDLRMVIEWSDRSVPFEFQFVNPEKKFFDWSHTLEQNKKRLYQEQEQGFQTEEFIIDDAPQGDWLVNIQYLGEADEFAIPPYLKYTIYRNYGTPEETKEIKVIKLYLQEDKVTLSKINA